MNNQLKTFGLLALTALVAALFSIGGAAILVNSALTKLETSLPKAGGGLDQRQVVFPNGAELGESVLKLVSCRDTAIPSSSSDNVATCSVGPFAKDTWVLRAAVRTVAVDNNHDGDTTDAGDSDGIASSSIAVGVGTSTSPTIADTQGWIGGYASATRGGENIFLGILDWTFIATSTIATSTTPTDPDQYFPPGDADKRAVLIPAGGYAVLVAATSGEKGATAENPEDRPCSGIEGDVTCNLCETSTSTARGYDLVMDLWVYDDGIAQN